MSSLYQLLYELGSNSGFLLGKQGLDRFYVHILDLWPAQQLFDLLNLIVCAGLVLAVFAL